MNYENMNYQKAINWNNIEDEMDKTMWEKLLSQFWVATRFPIANDLASWRKLHANEQQLVLRVFAGLTLLDTIQGNIGALELMKDAQTEHEKSVFLNIAFMEAIHAQSYSQIFQTLAATPEINEAFRWSEDNDFLQYKARKVQDIYSSDDPLKKKIASVLLESFLFYSGFYLPLHLGARGSLVESNSLITLIRKDESLHGLYVGYKYQQAIKKESKQRVEELTNWAYELLDDLYQNEVRYTQDLYDEHGLTEDVKIFLRYNANKALMNLGLDPLFPKEEVNPVILNGMSLETVAHDFFSTTGNYSMGEVEATEDEDWDF